MNGSCDKPEVLLNELSKARQADWKKVLSTLPALGREVGHEYAGGAVLKEEMEEEVRVVLQDLLRQAREEEGKQVRERTEAQYQQMVLQQVRILKSELFSRFHVVFKNEKILGH